jgi:rhamnogalacturonan hydrolase
MDPVDGDGIFYTNITFKNWYGDATDGETRAPIRVICPSTVPCAHITVDNINLWTDEGGYEEYLGRRYMQRLSNI